MRHDPLPYEERLERLRRGLAHKDALLILDRKNIRYLTGFTGSDGALLAGPDWLVLLVDGRYVTQAREEAPGSEIFEFRSRVSGIAEAAGGRGAEAIRFEAPSLCVDEYLKLQEKLPGVAFAPLTAEHLLLRAVKTAEEVARMREAARISAEALAAVREMIRPGVREREIAIELEYRMRLAGAEGAAFETIVAAGANAALPHATPGSRVIAAGDCVTVDCGAIAAGYCSDETCTYIVGKASDRQREVYGLVREAHDRAIRAIRAGMSCGAIDGVARGFLGEAGLGDCFSHGTGHGVGLDVHEAPRLAAGREEILEAGMVVTVEPGVYLPGLWGIRIEDLVLVTKEGCEVLTRTPKELTIL
jgi:Xaa-Pro aminopeptidase/Xaa-Pro dipeptidase